MEETMKQIVLAIKGLCEIANQLRLVAIPVPQELETTIKDLTVKFAEAINKDLAEVED